MVTISTTSSLPSICSYPQQFIGQKVSFNQSLPQRHIRFQPARISAVHASVEVPRSHHIASPASPYDVLGVHAGATCQEIKQAYRRLARVSHPDVASDDGRKSSSSADEFMRIHAAYATLSDPEKRADYDRAHFIPRRRTATATATATTMAGSSPDLGFSQFTRRRWETDQCW